jgi:hypothetical protein
MRQFDHPVGAMTRNKDATTAIYPRLFVEAMVSTLFRISSAAQAGNMEVKDQKRRQPQSKIQPPCVF